MDTFRDVSPEEAKLFALQFMGQHLTGDLKELNKNIISQNQTLQGMTLDPVRVINTISPSRSNANTVNAGINIHHSPPIAVQSSPPQIVSQETNNYNPDQLEFNFKQTDLDTIFNRLDSIDSKLNKIIESLKNN